ncbi:MAG: outer membrane beta-barrel protein [Bacteroidales bacterium]|nr:outer membrane beta-barrel protein [Bacteroidales bacterium]
MKRFTSLALVLLFGIGISVYSQEADTSKVRIGKKKYTIIVDDGKEVRIITDDNNMVEEEIEEIVIHEHATERKHKKRMDGTWEGFEFGLTNFVNSDLGLDLPADAGFMDVDMGRSWGFSLNFAEKSLGFASNYFGVVTGLGLEYNRYILLNDVKITEVDGLMTGVPVDMNLDNNRLSTTYINLPLMAEVQIPVYGENKRVILSGGVIGGLRIGSRQVQKFINNGEKEKIKTKDTFNLRDFRYGFTARVGYGDVALFANYYPQTMFNDGMGPDIYPITVGIHFGD